MRDILLDLIQHTQLDTIDLVKVVGTDKETQVTALSEQKTLIIFGNFNTPVAEFIGTFGMPNLTILKSKLSLTEYQDETSSITVIRGTAEDPNAPTTIHFETKNKDSQDDYRLMQKNLVEDRVKNVAFKGTTWDVEFNPSVISVQRMKARANVHSQELHFVMKTENKELKVYFGDPSTHNGNFVFQSNITGNLNKVWSWPVKVFLDIMDLPGDKTIKIANAGVTEITVDSGMSTWRYLLPAQAK